MHTLYFWGDQWYFVELSCWNMFWPLSSSEENCIATAYKDILYSRVPPTSSYKCDGQVVTNTYYKILNTFKK